MRKVLFGALALVCAPLAIIALGALAVDALVSYAAGNRSPADTYARWP
jgi:hypothetical protein